MYSIIVQSPKFDTPDRSNQTKKRLEMLVVFLNGSDSPHYYYTH